MNQIWESKPFMLLASVALLVNLNKILPNRSIDVPKRERIMGKTWLLVVVGNSCQVKPRRSTISCEVMTA